MTFNQVISLCCGAGIGSDGIEPHFDTALAVDSDWRACCSHIANHPGVRVVHGDVTDPAMVRWAGQEFPGISGIISTPPCPPFSQAGAHNPNDPRAAVFLAVLAWTAALNPAFAIVENVSGIKRSPYLLILVKRLEFLAYHVQTWLLDAASFGVPQHRKRLFVIATIAGLPIPPVPVPTHGPGLMPFKTLRDAMGDLPESVAQSLGCAALSPTRAALLAHVPPGGNWQSLPPDLKAQVFRSTKGKKPHPRIARRYSWSETPGALLTFPHIRNWTMPLPPHVNRPFSVVEFLRLQGIRRPFHLFGSIKERYAQVGNGVPPALTAAVCGSVAQWCAERKTEKSGGDRVLA